MKLNAGVLLPCFLFASATLAKAEDPTPAQGFEIVYRATMSESDSISLGIATPVIWQSTRFGLEIGSRYYRDSTANQTEYAEARATDFGAFMSSETPINNQLSFPIALHLNYDTYRKLKESREGTESGGHVAMDLDAGIRVRGSVQDSFFVDVGWLWRVAFLPKKIVIVGETVVRKSEPGVFIKIGYTFP